MKAVIWIQNSGHMEWCRIAARMAAEHAGYYAMYGQACAVNRAKAQAWCDAYNIGMHPYYIQRLVHAGLDDETDRLVGKDVWGESWEGITPDASPGADVDVDSRYARWVTSAGNALQVTLERGEVIARVDGRRHGIPWRFLDLDFARRAVVLGLESNSKADPWCDGRGNPLVDFKAPAEVWGPITVDRGAGWEDDPDADVGGQGGVMRECRQQAIELAERLSRYEI